MSIGVDEAGRGCLFGPVVACAIYVKSNKELKPPISVKSWDSKKISENKRNLLYDYIYKYADKVEVGIVDSKTIDKINILKSTMLAMHNAIDKIHEPIDIIYVDGNYFDNYIRNTYNHNNCNDNYARYHVASSSVIGA